MSKKKIRVPVLYSQFINAVHQDYRQTLPNLIQRGRRGKFPKHFRIEGNKRSPALFDRDEIMAWAEAAFGDTYPGSVEDVRIALGLGKKRKAKLSPWELLEFASRLPAPKKKVRP